jgi:hypothetical protein
MREEDIKISESDYPLSEYFDETQLLNWLRSKYGDLVMVEEWFEYEPEKDYIDIPDDFILYQEYKTPMPSMPDEDDHRYNRRQHLDPRDPDYDGPIDPGDIEIYAIYDAKFDELIKYLRDYYDAEDDFFEIFFKEYVYTKERRLAYIEAAKRKNAGKPRDRAFFYDGNYFTKAYAEIR